MDREQLALLGYGVLAVVLFMGTLVLLGNLLGLAVILALSFGLGSLAEHLYPSPYHYGRWQAVATGLAGSLVGSYFLGQWGPSLANIYLIPTLIGAVAVSAGLRAKVWYDRVKKLEEYQAMVNIDDPLLMARLEETRIIRLLGTGAFSRVYQAIPERNLRESESVAIKVFKESALAEDDEMAGRIEREASVCERLQHPNIVRILRSGKENKIHFLVMEFVEGATLAAKLEQGPMDLQEAVQILVELASALGYAHSQGVVHRDIKPENVMLTKKGPKIMDFGIARLAGTATLTQTGSTLGTPHYMSPEQAIGERELDGRCDQYSLGCLAFKMLTGETVFPNSQPVIVVTKHVQEAPRNPRDLRPAISEALAAVVLRMLSKKREDRYASMDGLVAELRSLNPCAPKSTVSA